MNQKNTDIQMSSKPEALGAKKEKKVTPLNSIRQHCLWCCCESMKDVRHCPAKSCSLYPFRLGKNPFQKRTSLTDEEKQKIANRLRSSRKHED